MPFLPGNKFGGNSPGRSRLPEDLRNVRKIGKDELKARVQRLLRFTPAQVKQVLEDPATDCFDNIICNIIIKACAFGDPTRLNWFMSLLIPKEQLEGGKESDLEDFKVEYMRNIDRKKLVALVKEGQEQKTNEDV